MHGDWWTPVKVEVMNLKLHLVWKQTNSLFKKKEAEDKLYLKTHIVCPYLRDLKVFW